MCESAATSLHFRNSFRSWEYYPELVETVISSGKKESSEGEERRGGISGEEAALRPTHQQHREAKEKHSAATERDLEPENSWDTT